MNQTQRHLLFPYFVHNTIVSVAKSRDLSFDDLVVEWIREGLEKVNLQQLKYEDRVIDQEPYVRSRIVLLPEELDVTLNSLVTDYPVDGLSDMVWRLIKPFVPTKN